MSIAKVRKNWNVTSFSLQFGSDSRNDQSVDVNHLPKQDFMLGFTFLLNIVSTFVLRVLIKGQISKELWSLRPIPGRI